MVAGARQSWSAIWVVVCCLQINLMTLTSRELIEGIVLLELFLVFSFMRNDLIRLSLIFFSSINSVSSLFSIAWSNSLESVRFEKMPWTSCCIMFWMVWFELRSERIITLVFGYLLRMMEQVLKPSICGSMMSINIISVGFFGRSSRSSSLFSASMVISISSLLFSSADRLSRNRLLLSRRANFIMALILYIRCI